MRNPSWFTALYMKKVEANFLYIYIYINCDKKKKSFGLDVTRIKLSFVPGYDGFGYEINIKEKNIYIVVKKILK
jgi:hypothetical protein